jgi:tripartite-type tricarboxylate transporter receptor subunit TctC
MPRAAPHLPAALVLAAAAAISIVPPADAQAWPARPVRLLVGWAPGGGVDVTARTIALRLADAWAQQIVIDNRPGAAGNLAGEMVVRANTDGYTLLLGSAGELAINAGLFGDRMPYDPLKDFSHVTLAVSVPNAVVIHPSVQAGNMKELIAASIKAPNGFAFASPGNGSVGHLTGEMLRMATGAKLLHIPYKGAAPATADLVGGQVQLSFSSMPAVLPFVKAGKLRMIAVTSGRRAASQPDLPTIAESGVPGFEATGWYGFVGPAGMAKERIMKINTDVAAALAVPDIRDRLVSQGLDPWPTSPEEMRRFVASEIAKWTKVIRQAGAKVD